MYKIIMRIPYLGDREVDMPADHNLTLKEALWRANLYSTKNPDVRFEVVEEA